MIYVNFTFIYIFLEQIVMRACALWTLSAQLAYCALCAQCAYFEFCAYGAQCAQCALCAYDT